MLWGNGSNRVVVREYSALPHGNPAHRLWTIVGSDLWPDEHQGLSDRKVVALPDVLIQADVPAAEGLKPVFDLLRQSAGFLGSSNYDESGEWRGVASFALTIDRARHRLASEPSSPLSLE